MFVLPILIGKKFIDTINMTNSIFAMGMVFNFHPTYKINALVAKKTTAGRRLRCGKDGDDLSRELVSSFQTF